MGLNFNRFSIHSQRWENEIAQFFFKFCNNGVIQKLKAKCLQLRDFCTLNIEHPRALQNSIRPKKYLLFGFKS